jgi:hypothetical protein
MGSTAHPKYLRDQIKSEVGGACGTWRGEVTHIQGLGAEHEGKQRLG